MSKYWLLCFMLLLTALCVGAFVIFNCLLSFCCRCKPGFEGNRCQEKTTSLARMPSRWILTVYLVSDSRMTTEMYLDTVAPVIYLSKVLSTSHELRPSDLLFQILVDSKCLVGGRCSGYDIIGYDIIIVSESEL